MKTEEWYPGKNTAKLYKTVRNQKWPTIVISTLTNPVKTPQLDLFFCEHKKTVAQSYVKSEESADYFPARQEEKQGLLPPPSSSPGWTRPPPQSGQQAGAPTRPTRTTPGPTYLYRDTRHPQAQPTSPGSLHRPGSTPTGSTRTR